MTKIQEISLRVFFPAMYACAGAAIFAIWAEEFIDESFFKLIPTFFIIGLAALITWGLLVLLEFKPHLLGVAKNIAKAGK